MLRTSLFLVAAMAGVAHVSAEPSPDYAKQIDQWRAQRLARLTAPDGWLSLVGLHWLKPGASTVGSAADSDVVLNAGPAHLGTLTWSADGKVRIALADGSGALIDGKPAASAELLDDSHDAPTRVSFGSAGFYLIDRAGRKGLRVKDPDAATRAHFLGLDAFPIDPSWRIEAKWIPFEPAHELEIPTVIGTVENYPVPGKAVFERDGHTYEILPVIEVPGDQELFVIFADRTSGKETYGAARFLYAPMPKDGKLVLDFNKAYNPPCAFTPYATCPLAPPENRLDLRVTAGEKKYRGAEH
ncbi:MAG: DUF1684 domain-containing protein [Mizugakiibacter sp.]|uniref:DUF1684 domain-containing protein n=1 Tax=Mizugakiibacter sp. TaxID=1972610 RepID=UPI0031C6A522|nr:DUF1684 domain-containing protein [Xanthomonadaceae bacterium]